MNQTVFKLTGTIRKASVKTEVFDYFGPIGQTILFPHHSYQFQTVVDSRYDSRLTLMSSSRPVLTDTLAV